MITFEVHTQEDSHLYENCVNYFNLMWNLAIPYNIFATKEKEYTEAIRNGLIING